MSKVITPLDAVKKNESYEALVDSIRIKLMCGEDTIDFDDDHDLDLAVLGRDFSAVELVVALNEYRTQGWQVEKIKKNIYQFTAAPIATAPSVVSAPSNNASVVPLSPDDVAKMESSDQVAEVIAIINRQLRDQTFNRIPNVLLKNFSEAIVKQAIEQFELVGWSIGSGPRDQECLYVQKI
jgi:hypothetical protein